MALRPRPGLRLDMLQGLRCQEPFPGQGPHQNKIRSIYLISDCSNPISTVIYCLSGSLVRHLFCFEPGLWLCVWWGLACAYPCLCRLFQSAKPETAPASTTDVDLILLKESRRFEFRKR